MYLNHFGADGTDLPTGRYISLPRVLGESHSGNSHCVKYVKCERDGRDGGFGSERISTFLLEGCAGHWQPRSMLDYP